MYSNYDNSSQFGNFYSIPFQEENDSYLPYYERQFGPMFPPPGAGAGIQPPGPPQGSPPGQGPGAGPPSAPPPAFVPAQSQQAQAFAIDPGSIRRCLFRFTYVWLRNRQQFWYYPTFVGRRSISGFRWNGFRWVYFGVSLRQIESFTCS
ncbi:hypothetical protein [Halalkalibacter krulwichiae]|uniref:hypothetical protein n=1 Tax=Halalkalibacter krulwichiae TaxID=199441 RepID=UPI000B1984D1|nr:hypothetical protein [Halalkalibacter krulwichiae]